VGCVEEGESIVGLDAGCEDMVEGGGLPVGGGRVCRDREGLCSLRGHCGGWGGVVRLGDWGGWRGWDRI
jgi:hypothetical protein